MSRATTELARWAFGQLVSGAAQEIGPCGMFCLLFNGQMTRFQRLGAILSGLLLEDKASKSAKIDSMWGGGGTTDVGFMVL